MRALLLASLVAFGWVGAARADVLSIDFTTHGGWKVPRTQVDSIGQLILTLNQSGTVTAQLDVAADQIWYGVGIDSGYGFDESNLSQGVSSAWGTSFGEFDTGVVCNQGCTGPAAWTISSAASISSVYQLTAGAKSDYDGWFYTLKDEYAGLAVTPAATSVPEPTSLALLSLPMGLAGVVAMRRRRDAGAV